MLIPIHEEMTRAALAPHVSPRALDVILAANKAQDKLSNQFGHDEIHFDNNAIEAGSRYIKEQRGYVLAALLTSGVLPAWVAFGRLTHTAQDFYSHTNYISLWMKKNPRCAPEAVDALDPDIIASPELFSGKLYLLDWLYFLPPLKQFALSRLPGDSHAKMNLDSPAQGEKFPYARAAAVQRTQREFDLLHKLLTPEMFAKFCDL
ncbi:MAG: hypothetical protein Fur002_14640 [Anaerolineales bacterium]